MSTTPYLTEVDGVRIPIRLGRKIAKDPWYLRNRIHVEAFILLSRKYPGNYFLADYVVRDGDGKKVPGRWVWDLVDQDDIDDDCLYSEISKQWDKIPKGRLKNCDPWSLNRVIIPNSDDDLRFIGWRNSEVSHNPVWGLIAATSLDKVWKVSCTHPWETGLVETDGVWRMYNIDPMLSRGVELSAEEKDGLDGGFGSREALSEFVKAIWYKYETRSPFPQIANHMWNWNRSQWEVVECVIEAMRVRYPAIVNDPLTYCRYIYCGYR